MAPRVVDRTAMLVARPDQHRANVAFARAYVGRSAPRSSTRKRVLISGFGRFPPHATNATATLVCRLAGLSDEKLPRVPVAAEGTEAIDDPARHVLVVDCTLTLPIAGIVDARVLVLPVFWDVASLIALREIDAFEPDVVLMNGIGREDQPIVLEASASNRESNREDASLRVFGSGTEIVLGAAPIRRVSCASVDVAKAAGIELGEARADNVYLCNQLTYLVDHTMAHPDHTLRLLRAAEDDPGVDVTTRDLRSTPRMFVHWPANLAGDRLLAGLATIRSLLDAQLAT